MSNLRKHIIEHHQPALTERDIDSLGAHGDTGTMRDIHNWAHDEYGNNPNELNHWHTEHGQLIFHDRRGER